MKCNRPITVAGTDGQASAWVKTPREPLGRRTTTVDGHAHWDGTKSIRMPGVTHTVRITVRWKRQRDAAPRPIGMRKRTSGDVHGIRTTYRKRWTGTETCQRDGKQHLGMGDCQLRSGARHSELFLG